MSSTHKQIKISLYIVFNKGDMTTLHLRPLRINFSSVDNFAFIKSSRNDFAGLFCRDFRTAAERLALDVFRPRHERLFLHAPRVFFDALLCLLLFGARAQMTLRFSASTSNSTRLFTLLDVVYNDPQDRLGRCVFTAEVSVDLLKYACKLGTDCKCFLSAASLCARARRLFVHSESPEYEPLFFGRTFFDEIFAVVKLRKRSNALTSSVSL